MIPTPRPQPDSVLLDIANYVDGYEIQSELAFVTARYCLIDALGCALEALQFSACSKLLGPIVPGATLRNGARVPGTQLQLNPVQAAFNIGTMIRWLDYNDTWVGAEWSHPSDNLGGILALADWLTRSGVRQFTMRSVLIAMIKAYEIQGCLGLENAFNKVGLDHVVLVKVASTAVLAKMLGLSRDQIIDAVSLAWVDGQSLRTYRQAPNTGSRKSWAAGDATSRGVWLALLTNRGEMGYPSVLSTPRWGFYDVLFGGKEFRFQRPYGTFVMENILFKVSFPSEFHAQTAVEAALELHERLKQIGKGPEDIAKVTLLTQAACLTIIDKKGALFNPADRDHCIQYAVAIALIFGRLTAADYGDCVARDPRIDILRAKTACVENPRFTCEYFDPEKRSVANTVIVELESGEVLESTVEYPIGHKRRRGEALPMLEAKFKRRLAQCFSPERCQAILDLSLDQERFEKTLVDDYLDHFVV